MKLLNGMRYGPGRDIRMTASGMVFPENHGGSRAMTLDVESDPVNLGKLKVLPGSVVWHGHAVYDYGGESGLEFTGGVRTAPQYLFVEFTWATGAIAIAVAEEYPETDVDKYRHVLVEGYLDQRDDPIPDVSVVTFIHHHGDIHIATAFA
jgi:hypothetical protein